MANFTTIGIDHGDAKRFNLLCAHLQINKKNGFHLALENWERTLKDSGMIQNV